MSNTQDPITRQLFGDDEDLLRPCSLREITEQLHQAQILTSNNLEQLAVIDVSRRQRLCPCYDSRLLQPWHIFVALIGENLDGHNFIPQVLEMRCKSVVYQRALPAKLLAQLSDQNIAAFQVSDSRQALSLLSAYCFGQPSHQLPVLGITGTDGKTSIAYLSYQILQAQYGPRSGLLSTFGVDLGQGLQPNPVHQTTPESLIVQRALARMKANGCLYAVLECSSHGLSPRTARLMHVQLAGALFSNLSPEHLEFHGSMECYIRDKARIFELLKPGGAAVWQVDEPTIGALYAFSGARQDLRYWGYKVNPTAKSNKKSPKLALPHQAIPPYEGLLRAENSKFGVANSQFELFAPEISSALSLCQIDIPGSAYVENTLGAITLCCATLPNSDPHALLKALQKSGNPQLALRAPKGRMELLPANTSFTVLIDYAHSPGSFSRLLPEMRHLLAPNARMLVLFGSGGERDRQKRPRQGALAAQYADIIVLCNEDPRNEDEMAILKDIQDGIPSESGFTCGKNLFLIPERRLAMSQLFSLARPNDLVLLLGKGHEQSIILAKQREIPWDEREVALELLHRPTLSCKN